MNIIEISSAHSQTFKTLLAIKKGESKDDLVIIEGNDLIEEAKRAKALKATIAASREALVPAESSYIIPEFLISRLSNFKTPAKVLGIAKVTKTKTPGDNFIYLDGVQDPGNVGTIIRTALCFGFSSVMISPESASLTNSKVIQASKGAIFRIPVGVMDYRELLATKAHLYLTLLEGKDEREFDHLEKPCGIVLGNEGQGIPKDHRAVGTPIRIAMGRFDSLNVAVAAAIFMYRFQSR